VKRRMFFRIMAPLVVVAGVIGALNLVSNPAVSAPHAGVATAPLGTQASTQAVAAYNTLIDRIYGTPEQRRKGEQLVNHLQDTAMRACMDGAGYGYEPSPVFAGIAVQAAPADLDLVAPLGDFHQTRGAEQNARALQAALDSGNNRPFQVAKALGVGRQYIEANNACTAKEETTKYFETGRPEGRALSSGNRALAEQMAGVALQFEQQVAALQATPEAQKLLDSYRACLKTHGFTAGSWLDLYKQVAARFQGTEGMALTALSKLASWGQAVAFEQNAQVADRACRSEIRSWAIASLQPVVDSYLVDPMVATLAATWQAIENEATAAGLS
jgi:hypothetical protein